MEKPGAVVVVVLRDNSVLAVSRKDCLSAFGLPGGKVEAGETAEEAASRELLEETGWQVEPADLRSLYVGVEPATGTMVASFLAPEIAAVDDIKPHRWPRQDGEGVLVWAGWPSLTEGPFGAYNAAVRTALAQAIPEHWAAAYGSGTLRRALEEGMAWRELYLHERVAFEFGYGFSPAQRSRLNLGQAFAEGDSPGTTETCWWARALRWRAAQCGRPATVSVHHARLADGDGGAREGIAIVYAPKVRPSWLPADRSLVAFTTTAEGRTENPC